jgi:hypothetical protein
MYPKTATIVVLAFQHLPALIHPGRFTPSIVVQSGRQGSLEGLPKFYLAFIPH